MLFRSEEAPVIKMLNSFINIVFPSHCVFSYVYNSLFGVFLSGMQVGIWTDKQFFDML